MRVYPEKRLDFGPDMRNDCTCGHCRLAHVKRESNTARVYKVQLPPVKTKKAKAPPKKAVAPKLVYGYPSVPKRKPKARKPVRKSVVRSQPEYDAWYFSDADLRTIARSNMENYLSRFQPDLQEMGTQTSTPVTSPKPARLPKTPSRDKAVQIRLSEKEVDNSFNTQHKDRGDSPTRRNSPVALSALMNYKQASGDFDLRKPPDNLRYNGNSNSKKEPEFDPLSEKLIPMPPAPQQKAEGSNHPPYHELGFDDLFRTHTNSRESKRLTDLDDLNLNFKSPFQTKLLHSTSKNRLRELLDLGKHHSWDDVLKSQKAHRLKYDKKHRPNKIPRKLLETSLKKEKEARKSLKIENEDLKSCISKAEQKVRDIRSSLADLSNTIRTYKTKSSLPYVTRVENLEKIVDDLIREFRSSGKTKVGVRNSPKMPAPNQKDIRANYVVISTEPQRKNKITEGKKDFGDGFDGEMAVADDVERLDWSNLSSISSGIVPRSMTVSTATTSLTALKEELGKFFEDMREDTEKLIEEAELHQQALLSYSERTSIAPSYDSSTAST